MQRSSPDFSIVTPSYNMLSYLQRCCASVSDQADINYEHLIHDACSTDGTVEWLACQSQATPVVEPDLGMYDAINKGFNRATGSYLGYLNCDEQYLPGTLRFVKDYFEENPDVDIVFGSALLVGPNGTLISYRKTYQPRRMYVQTSHLYLFSACMFLRRRVIDAGLRFNESLKDIGDEKFVLDCMEYGFRVAAVPEYFSTFTLTGSNRNTQVNARQEKLELSKSLPVLLRITSPIFNILRLTEKFLSGAYWQSFPLTYRIYTSETLVRRSVITANAASCFWINAPSDD